MLNDSDQRRIAAYMFRLFQQRGLDAVLVGSTAVIALNLYERTSKDADFLSPPDFTLQAARTLLGEIAVAEELVVVEKGWGTVSLARQDGAGDVLWEVDLIVPAGEMVPVGAAARIHEQAVQTSIGRAAKPEHILGMKAVAYGDCVGKGRHDEAARYESDLLELRRVIQEDFAWEEVAVFLLEFHEARRRPASEKIYQIFGRDLKMTPKWDPAHG